MPGSESVPQIVPAEIEYACTLQRVAPALGIDLHDWLALAGESMRRVIALALSQRNARRLIARPRVRPAVLVVGT